MDKYQEEQMNKVHTTINTPLGVIQVVNVSGNLKLQELIDEFAEKLKTV